jgi:hypothetical protein
MQVGVTSMMGAHIKERNFIGLENCNFRSSRSPHSFAQSTILILPSLLVSASTPTIWASISVQHIQHCVNYSHILSRKHEKWTSIKWDYFNPPLPQSITTFYLLTKVNWISSIFTGSIYFRNIWLQYCNHTCAGHFTAEGGNALGFLSCPHSLGMKQPKGRTMNKIPQWKHDAELMASNKLHDLLSWMIISTSTQGFFSSCHWFSSTVNVVEQSSTTRSLPTALVLNDPILSSLSTHQPSCTVCCWV